MRPPRTLATVSLVVLAGCMHTSAFVLGEQRFPPQPAGYEVLVFDTAEDVTFPYTKVARLVASGTSQTRWDSVLDALKAKAREVGADALVLSRGGDDAADLDAGGVVMRRTLWALAIRRQQPAPSTSQ